MIKAGENQVDKYIKILLLKLLPHYKTTVVTTMYYDEEKQKFSNLIRVYLTDKKTNETHSATCGGQRALVSELMKWLKD